MKRLMIVAALSVAACSSPAPVELDDGAVAMAQPAAPAVVVTVAQLVAAFEANEVAAMQDYGDVPVQLTGKVRGVVLDFTDDPAVLFESGQTRPVQALFDKDRGAATGALKKGQQATVVCNEVREVMGLPILDDCILAAPPSSAPDPSAIEAAKTAISTEPKVKDVRYDGGETVQWHVGVLDDGTERSGFAVYICQLIEAKGATTGRTHVRIVDMGKVAAGADFRTASLGHVICETGEVVDP